MTARPGRHEKPPHSHRPPGVACPADAKGKMAYTHFAQIHPAAFPWPPDAPPVRDRRTRPPDPPWRHALRLKSITDFRREAWRTRPGTRPGDFRENAAGDLTNSVRDEYCSFMGTRDPFKASEVVSRRGGAAKQPLSRDIIVAAALDLLTQEGLDGLSLRKVAAALDTGAASLYAYVEDLQELHALLLDRALAGR